MNKLSKKSKFLIMFLLLLIIIVSMINMLRNYDPNKNIQRKPPTDYFIDAFRLPYIENDKYTILNYEAEIFESFTIFSINEKSVVDKFVNDLIIDELTVEQNVVNGVAPVLNLIEEYSINDIPKVDILPFDLKCDCYRYFTYNHGQIDGGYLYLIFIYENLIIIDYYAR